MEYWDIYDEKKQKTGRTMKRNDWNMKPDEYHLTVLGVLKRRWPLSDHPEKAGQRMGCRLVGSTGRRSQRGRRFQGRSNPRDPRGDRN